MSEEVKVTETQETETETVETQEEVKSEVKEEVKTPTKNELLRELSKEHGVNLFDPEGIQKFKEYQESLKTEAEKRAEELNSLNERLKQYEAEAKEKDFNLAALSLGIPKERHAEAKALMNLEGIKGDTDSERLADVRSKYPALFQSQSNKQDNIEFTIGTQMSEKEEETAGIVDEALARYEANKNKKFKM